jgi:hypothetical protein
MCLNIEYKIIFESPLTDRDRIKLHTLNKIGVYLWYNRWFFYYTPLH